MEIVILKQPEDPFLVQKLCPFGAIDVSSDDAAGPVLSINAGCRFCRVCVKKYPEIFAVRESSSPARAAGLKAYRGVAVYIERSGGGYTRYPSNSWARGGNSPISAGRVFLAYSSGGRKRRRKSSTTLWTSSIITATRVFTHSPPSPMLPSSRTSSMR